MTRRVDSIEKLQRRKKLSWSCTWSCTKALVSYLNLPSSFCTIMRLADPTSYALEWIRRAKILSIMVRNIWGHRRHVMVVLKLLLPCGLILMIWEAPKWEGWLVKDSAWTVAEEDEMVGTDGQLYVMCDVTSLALSLSHLIDPLSFYFNFFWPICPWNHWWHYSNTQILFSEDSILVDWPCDSRASYPLVPGHFVGASFSFHR